MYANSENCLLVIARERGEVVGAVSGIPLHESNKEEDKKLFAAKKIPAEGVFYLGEIISLREYLKSDVEQRLYQHFEEAVLGSGKYNTIVVCEIERDAEDPKKPLGDFPSEVL
jgi:hypothetical protein